MLYGGVDNFFITFHKFSLWNKNKCLDLQPKYNYTFYNRIYQKDINMIFYEYLKIGESCSLSSFVLHTGLAISCCFSLLNCTSCPLLVCLQRNRALTSSALVRGMRPIFKRVNRAIASSTFASFSSYQITFNPFPRVRLLSSGLK